jgi:hypothetical protein
MKRKQLGRLSGMLVVALALLTVTLGCGGSKSAIVGRWDMADSHEIWEFYSDGTLTSSGGLIPMGGNYEFISSDRIRIEFGGLGALTGPQVFRVEISGDRLTLVPEYDPSDVWEFTKLAGR